MKNKEQNEKTVYESKNQTIPVVNGPKEFDVFMEQNPGTIVNVVIELAGGKDG